MRPRKAPRTPEISRCRSPPRSGQSQPAPSTEAPPVDEQRSTKSARAKVLGKNSQKGPPAGKRAKKERTGGGSPRRPRAFWGPGAAFWGFLGAWGAVGKKAGNGPNRTRLIEIGLTGGLRDRLPAPAFLSGLRKRMAQKGPCRVKTRGESQAALQIREKEGDARNRIACGNSTSHQF